jgi:transposase
MPRRRLICTELSPDELRQAARASTDRRAAMRMLAIANSIEGMSRSEAARLADMSDQALSDAIGRYNAEGIAGLCDRARSGRPRKLTDAQRQELRAKALAGPDIETEGFSAYTRADLGRHALATWGVKLDPTSIGRTLRSLGLSRQKPRPSHPKKDPAAAEALKKGPRHSAETCRYT